MTPLPRDEAILSLLSAQPLSLELLCYDAWVICRAGGISGVSSDFPKGGAALWAVVTDSLERLRSAGKAAEGPHGWSKVAAPERREGRLF